MRVILIDPWIQTIVATSKLAGYKDYYRLLSGTSPDGLHSTPVTCFDITMVNTPANHLLVVDDEGFLKSEQAYFELDGRTFAGRGVLIGDSGREDDGPATVSTDDLLALIRWIPVGSRVCISRPIVRGFDTTDELLRFLGEE
ncbi:MAG: hypothetical protein MUC44_00305 [Beijerinckiaceae bacterium]|jgi:hypothetical protein|nr:hypothetical protein [Beijerinckiaceae bacterium]